MSSYDVTTWCQMHVNKPPSKPRSPPTCICANKYIMKSCGKMAFTFQCRCSLFTSCINKMSCVGLTGSPWPSEWSAFGKPLGTVARVCIGHVTMPILTKLQNKEHVTETLPSSGSPATR